MSANKPIRRFLPPLFALALALLLLAPAGAQDWKGRGRINGSVSDTEGNPIKDAKVNIYFRGKEGEGPKPVRTDKKGRWAYMGLSTSPYTVVVEAEGYVPAQSEVRVNEYSQAPAPPVEVVLRPVGEAGGSNAEGERLMGLIESGNRLMQEGKFADARKSFEEVLTSLEDPVQRWPIELAVAGTYLGEENAAEARARYEVLLTGATEPADQIQVHRSIARTHYIDGNIDASVASLNQALVLVPEDVDTLRLIVDTLLASGREEEAEPYIARLPAGEKIDPNALLNLGISAYNAGEMDAASEKFHAVLAAYPDNANAYYYLGLVQMGQEKNGEAKASFAKMLELDPEHPSASEAQQFLEYLNTL